MSLLTFDIRGNLTPYQPIEVTVELFRETFVDSFGATSTRHSLWRGFENFVADFREQISESFHLWVNGSFTTIRRNPKDIDLVILLDVETALKRESLLKQKFTGAACQQHYGMDAYLVRIYPRPHPEYFKTRSGRAYWQD